MKHVVLLLTLVSVMSVMAQPPKPIMEVSELRLVNNYQAAVIANQTLQADKAAVERDTAVLNKTVEDFNNMVPEEVKKNGLPEGSTFNIDLTKPVGKRITVNPPPPKKEEAKPEAKPEVKPDVKPDVKPQPKEGKK